MTDPRRALAQLRQAADAGELAALCRRHGVTLLVAFGSTVRDEPHPRDLDLAVRFNTQSPDFLGFLNEISAIASASEIDLMDLRLARPVAKKHALVGGVPLLEEQPGTFARTQLAAMMEYLDTASMRRIELELMTR